MEKRDLVIIGGGPAGLSAAIYGRRSGLDVLILEKGVYGGQINVTDEVENYPGVAHASGMELAELLKKHADKFSPEFRDATVKKIEVRGDSRIVITEAGEIEAEAVIVATGAEWKKLGCKGESEFTGKGVSYCAVCDGAFFQDETIAVIGGGNTAVEEAVYLTQFASKVYLVHRRDAFRADKLAIERALSNPKITPVYNSVVEEIAGGDMVEKLILKNIKSGEVSELAVAGVFLFVGMDPVSSFVKDLVETNHGYVKVNGKMETSVEGVYAAGDVCDKELRQIITAASDGAIAAMSAQAYVGEQKYLKDKLFTPKRVNAFVYRSIEPAHMQLLGEIEKSEKDGDVAVIDAYRNAGIACRLGVSKLPALVRICEGKVVAAMEEIREISAALSFIDK